MAEQDAQQGVPKSSTAEVLRCAQELQKLARALLATVEQAEAEDVDVVSAFNRAEDIDVLAAFREGEDIDVVAAFKRLEDIDIDVLVTFKRVHPEAGDDVLSAFRQALAQAETRDVDVVAAFNRALAAAVPAPPEGGS